MRTSEARPETARGVPAAELSEVAATFPTRKGPITALDGLSAAIPAGTVFCLLGPNGAGKTTTVNVLTGLVAPDDGTVRIFGRDPVADRARALRQLALVPQETALYERLTARENLVFHGRYYGVDRRTLPGRIDAVLELVGLADRQGDRVETFSGGMRRRLALARALLGDAGLVLLDEPTVGVDVQSRNAIWERIRALAADGRAVLLTTNYMDEAEALADEILLLDRGREVVSGTAADLRAAVGGRRLVLQFAANADADRAGRELAAAGHDAVAGGDAVTVELASPERALRELPRITELTAGRLQRIELREPSLQDVFLHFTGRGLRD